MTDTQIDRTGDYRDRCAVVAGGSAGVGLATARQLAQEGWGTVIILGRNEDKGRRAVDEVRALATGTHVDFIAGDLGDHRVVTEVVERIRREQGRIDALVTTTHGGAILQILGDMELERMESMLTDHVMAVFYLCRAVLPVMQQTGGSVVVVSSDAAKVPTPGESMVGAGMAALSMFARAMALEVKRHGIRVNVVTPSVVSGTASFDTVMADELGSRVFKKIEKMAALGIPTPGDLADLIQFLVSDESKRLTGQSVSVNGGISAM